MCLLLLTGPLGGSWEGADVIVSISILKGRNEGEVDGLA
jgi:hypothetical protein